MVLSDLPSDSSALSLPEPVSFDLETAPVPPELREVWRKMLRESKASPLTLRAVYRAAVLGETWCAAAAAEGIRKEVAWQLARRWGLAGRRREQMTQGFARIVTLGQDLLEERLLEAPGSLDTKDVAILTGISSDKLMKAWERPSPDAGYSSLLDKIAQGLAESGGTVKLELTVTPADPADRARDVTPEPAELEV